MIGFGIRETNLENGKACVDGVDSRPMSRASWWKRGDAAIAQAVDAFGDLIAEIAAGQDGAGLFGKLGFVEAALDFALAGSQLSA